MDFRAQLRPPMLTPGNEQVNECIIQIRTYIVLRADTSREVTEGLESEMAERAFTVFLVKSVLNFTSWDSWDWPLLSVLETPIVAAQPQPQFWAP